MIVIAVSDSHNDVGAIKQQLVKMGVPPEKLVSMFGEGKLLSRLFPQFTLDLLYPDDWVHNEKDPRVCFLKSFAMIAKEKNYRGSVA